MVKEYAYINIREILSRILRHPLLQDVTLEQAVQYTIDFLGIFGMPKLYTGKEEVIHIEDYRGKLPCDLISINQVKDTKSGICMPTITNSFANSQNSLGFKTQGQVIYTSFKTGDINISYKDIPVDKDGFPLLIDNPVFLKALEAYIKKEVFTILFDMGKVSPQVLQNAQQQYSWLAGQIQSEFTIPSMSEMESIKNSWCALLQKTNEFSKGFSSVSKEHLKI